MGAVELQMRLLAARVTVPGRVEHQVDLVVGCSVVIDVPVFHDGRGKAALDALTKSFGEYFALITGADAED
ncbi:hypothetical protein ABZ540_33870 [Nocardia xishanensis]|uniref:hypothetical protein n=1 Tax=Nocardia xishanensis TaxID=238964 RepID=UPI003403C4EC